MTKVTQQSRSQSCISLKQNTKQKTTTFSTLANEKSLSDCKRGKRRQCLALLIQLDVITQFLWGLSVYWSAIILECSFFVPILHLFKNPKVCVLENMRVHHCIF
ncbi:uncharacterized protein LOC102369765 isoform X2 [Alligator sinensis]|uniref:Uncharacterized protein LOC102369765 isoform X2 n=1 Tax=Alligator sinensis TaxID=38654 RepID=A0A3Q0FJW7_ALLSI|nr:uncharacterized protein LOC102369765 isoform X2 [Alligator sinensis]